MKALPTFLQTFSRFIFEQNADEFSYPALPFSYTLRILTFSRGYFRIVYISILPQVKSVKLLPLQPILEFNVSHSLNLITKSLYTAVICHQSKSTSSMTSYLITHKNKMKTITWNIQRWASWRRTSNICSRWVTSRPSWITSVLQRFHFWQ